MIKLPIGDFAKHQSPIKEKQLVNNRPGVAGAVLHTASLLINLVSQSLILFLQIFTKKINVGNLKSVLIW